MKNYSMISPYKINPYEPVTFTGQKHLFNILIVDDRPENLLTLQGVLENGKRNFFSAESGNEALKIALKEPLSLIILDIQMSDMDGLETARLLRLNPRTRPIPLLFVSAINPKEKHPILDFEPGTVDFLLKPLNLEDTRTKVAIFEKLWQTTYELNLLKVNSERIKKDFDNFVYMVSHDLKTPLRALTNLSNWISEELPETSNSNVKENLSLLRDRVRRMNMMIEGIIEFSRVGRMHENPEKINVKQLVHSIFESLMPSAGFQFETTGSWPELITEKSKLEKIFRILIGNALEHHDKSEGLIRIDCLETNPLITFTVADDGPGIKPQYHNTIFEMFQTLNPKDHKLTSGTGLAIIKKLIEENGGTISVESQDSKGSAFTFTWPS